MELFHARYEMDTDLGRLFQQAQSKTFANNSKGVAVTRVVMDKVTSEFPGNATYPPLGPNTKTEDFEEALFVRSCGSTTYCDIIR